LVIRAFAHFVPPKSISLPQGSKKFSEEMQIRVGLQPAISGAAGAQVPAHNEPGCHFMVGDNLVTLGPAGFWLGPAGPLGVKWGLFAGNGSPFGKPAACRIVRSVLAAGA
jgi:hypothetical protein